MLLWPMVCPLLSRKFSCRQQGYLALGETAIMTCKVEGNPAPTFRWVRGMREVMHGGRFKHLTDGENSRISLIMQKAR